jgi:hypothetical protein
MHMLAGSSQKEEKRDTIGVYLAVFPDPSPRTEEANARYSVHRVFRQHRPHFRSQERSKEWSGGA